MLLRLFFYIGLLLAVQVMQYFKKDLLAIYKMHPSAVGFVYAVMFYLMIMHGAANKAFVYFQF